MGRKSFSELQSESALHWLEAAGSEIDSDLFEQRRREARQDLVNYGARLNVVNSRGVRPDDIRAMWNHDLQPEFHPEPISEGIQLLIEKPFQIKLGRTQQKAFLKVFLWD